MNRDQFRQKVLERDHNKCVICQNPAQDAHHIMERRLFIEGGYDLDNGASLCATHHIQAEQTLLTCEEIRTKAGIARIVLPEHLYEDERYDKWGNPYLNNNQRLQGELYYDPNVQKIIVGNFTTYVKHPRTHHVPWSPNIKNDDRALETVVPILEHNIVITEKMDGEQTTMYSNHIHARSIVSSPHVSRTWAKQLWSTVAGDIPPNMRICGENIYAKHSVQYDGLPSYFLVHSVWIQNTCLNWEEPELWCKLLNLQTVPVLFHGKLTEKELKEAKFFNPKHTAEGWVVRVENEFSLSRYKTLIGNGYGKIMYKRMDIGCDRQWYRIN